MANSRSIVMEKNSKLARKYYALQVDEIPSDADQSRIRLTHYTRAKFAVII